jgi:hypothetical protein
MVSTRPCSDSRLSSLLSTHTASVLSPVYWGGQQTHNPEVSNLGPHYASGAILSKCDTGSKRSMTRREQREQTERKERNEIAVPVINT